MMNTSTVKKTPIQQKPPYPIESVDNALRILQMMRDEGEVRITDVAAALGVAPSTAHRLMAMLIYRGFAIRDDSRHYSAGPALGASAIGSSWTRTLRVAVEPTLEILSSRLDETVNLIVRVGISARFLTSIESSTLLRVGDRTGSVLPARSASGGKVLLAFEPLAQLERLYRGKSAELSGDALNDADFALLVADMAAIRRRGYAINREETETGVGAIGIPVLTPAGAPIASFSVAAPVGRLERLLAPDRLELMFSARDDMTEALKGTALDRPGVTAERP
jgi:DNA-binding IclR family transcriptional regulator